MNWYGMQFPKLKKSLHILCSKFILQLNYLIWTIHDLAFTAFQRNTLSSQITEGLNVFPYSFLRTAPQLLVIFVAPASCGSCHCQRCSPSYFYPYILKILSPNKTMLVLFHSLDSQWYLYSSKHFQIDCEN